MGVLFGPLSVLWPGSTRPYGAMSPAGSALGHQAGGSTWRWWNPARSASPYRRVGRVGVPAAAVSFGVLALWPAFSGLPDRCTRIMATAGMLHPGQSGDR